MLFNQKPAKFIIMKWTNERSGNVDDRRGMSSGGKIIGGGVGTIVIAALIYFLGGDPSTVINLSEGLQPAQTEQRELTESEKQVGEMVKMITAWNEETWTQIFREDLNKRYTPATVVLFTEVTQSACGTAQAAMGPFYCPADQKVYVDMVFFDELQRDFGAEATEFTVAYVLAHEMGHHVQHLLGILNKQNEMRMSGKFSEKQMNEVSVAVELQADFLAGVWAKKNNERSGNAILEPGDIESAVEAAQAVGDDNIQQRHQGYVNQDSFTHGSSKQRVEWFLRGYKTGDINQGDTFSALLN